MELLTPSEFTPPAPTTRVTDAAKDEEVVAEFSAQILAVRFSTYLKKNEQMDEAAATAMGNVLKEFMSGEVPEIGAIETLRNMLRQDYSPPTETYAQAKVDEPSLTPKQWFDDNYKKGAQVGLVNSLAIQKHESGFPRAFNRARPDGLTLGATIEVAKEAKYDALCTLVGAGQKTLDLVLERTKSGRPSHKKVFEI